ncbi:hypothetical protein ACHHYP_02872 [Achlya hypogyna]|uniref:Secreted protein n=1 Tax=Achlya hypogyna TaxID=1202772 RepID=A0A0A7CLX1_ACHHY|nr:secreted protein [Achlya hypogyna]OQS00682.1 hypothetical protein ACHHYP_02872 [Achlya hypogyna]
MRTGATAALITGILSTVLANPLLRSPSGVSAFGDEDAWVFSRIWYPAYCATASNAVVCTSPPSYLTTNLVAENLIPAYNDGSTQTGLCRYEYGVFRPNNIASVGQDKLVQYWPFAEATDLPRMWSGGFDGNTPEFNWTCGGLHQGAYLKKIVELTIDLGTPPLLSTSVGTDVDVAKLRTALTASNGAPPVLVCDGANLVRVLTCYGKNNPDLHTTTDPTYDPQNAIACPSGWQQKDSCHEATVHVASF